jgi:hypothetical protein
VTFARRRAGSLRIHDSETKKENTTM